MTSKLISRVWFVAGSLLLHANAALAATQGGTITTTNDCPPGKICLLEKIGNCSQLGVVSGLGIFVKYFNLLWPILIGSGAGIAVLMAVVGGIQIIASGGDQGKRQEGIDRFKNALLGLLMCMFAGLILRTLNPSFFQGGAAGVPGGGPC